jgi:hypothetical protein
MRCLGVSSAIRDNSGLSLTKNNATEHGVVRGTASCGGKSSFLQYCSKITFRRAALYGFFFPIDVRDFTGNCCVLVYIVLLFYLIHALVLHSETITSKETTNFPL